MDISKLIFLDNGKHVEFGKVTNNSFFLLNINFIKNNKITNNHKAKIGFLDGDKDTCYMLISDDGFSFSKSGKLLYLKVNNLVSRGILQKGKRYNPEKIEENLFKFTIIN